jgi:hypothetical protein
VNVAATLILTVLAAIGPYGVLLRIFWGLAACGAAAGAAASFVKLREAVRDDGLGRVDKPST